MLYKIDEVAKECGLTKRTLRYYEEIGLIRSPKRSEGGIRLYSQDDIDQLKKIIGAREVLGFSLQELQQYVHYAQMLKEQRAEYEARMNSLAPEERKRKLEEIDKTLGAQLEMMEQKIASIRKFQDELQRIQKLVQSRLSDL